ncbi:MAG: maiA [Gammaproteobacteria bacterium]|nr:maiA [Gammaproteobacteria bacterium]
MLKLYTYFRSSAAFRVRIALNLKGLTFEAIPVHLLRDGGEQHGPLYGELNPARLVPTLQNGAFRVTQSLAIMEYLEETYPDPPLLPRTPESRATVRALAMGIACDIHPLNNLRVMQYLEGPLDIDEAGRMGWARHWVELGFGAIERTLVEARTTGTFCHGDSPTLADCCLVPQVFNALRLKCPIADYPTIMRLYEHCMLLEPFQLAAPAAQIDAPCVRGGRRPPPRNSRPTHRRVSFELRADILPNAG